MARLIGPDKRVVVNQCTQWKRYSTPGTATRGEHDPAGRVQVGELADRHDEAPDGQVAGSSLRGTPTNTPRGVVS